MKKILFLSLLLFVLVSNTQAQEEEKANKSKYNEKHLNEIYFEYGSPGVIWGTVEPVVIKTERLANSPLGESLMTILSDLLYGESINDNLEIYGFQCYGVATLSYQRHLHDQQWLGLGGEIAYAYCRVKGGNEYNVTTIPVHILMPTISVNFYYLRRKIIELYSGLTAGLGMWIDSDETAFFYAGHFNAFGISVGGEHLRFHCEIGAGMKGAINLGLGYKF